MHSSLKDDIIIDVNLANIKGDSDIQGTESDGIANGVYYQRNGNAETWTPISTSTTVGSPSVITYSKYTILLQ